MKTLLVATGGAVLLAGLVSFGFGRVGEKPGAAPPEPKKPTVMQRKLTHAQKLLAALATDDFPLMSKSAEELRQCASEASWQVVKSAKYERYSNDFIRDMGDLQKAAKDKNTDKAALAYVSMTMTCVKCHQYVREEKIGSAPDLRPFAADALAAK